MLYLKYVILYATHSRLTFKYQRTTFPKTKPSSRGCYLLEKEVCFELVIVPCCFAEPLYPNVCLDHRIISTFSSDVEKSK